MQQVIVRPRFKCDFCKKRSVRHVIARHEPGCYLNPKRVCWNCEGTGTMDAGDDNCTQIPCIYCERYKDITEQRAKEKAEFEKFEKSLSEFKDLF